MANIIFHRSKESLAALFCTMAGGFLLGMMICFLVVRIFPDGEETTTAMIASFFAATGAVIAIVIWGGIGLQNSFCLAVCMSHSRKRFLLEEGLVSVALSAVALLLMGIFTQVDLFVLGHLYAGIPIDQDLNMEAVAAFIFANPVNLICVFFLIIALRLLLGALYMRFGQWAFWGMWLVMMTCFTAVSRSRHGNIIEAAQGIVRTVTRLSAYLHGLFFQTAGIAAALAIIIVSVLLIRKQ